jgi:hypothetical protein
MRSKVANLEMPLNISAVMNLSKLNCTYARCHECKHQFVSHCIAYAPTRPGQQTDCNKPVARGAHDLKRLVIYLEPIYECRQYKLHAYMRLYSLTKFGDDQHVIWEEVTGKCFLPQRAPLTNELGHGRPRYSMNGGVRYSLCHLQSCRALKRKLGSPYKWCLKPLLFF